MDKGTLENKLPQVFALLGMSEQSDKILRTWGVTYDDVLGKCHQPHMTAARHALWALLDARGWSSPAIARASNRHHSTVLYALGKVRKIRDVGYMGRQNRCAGAVVGDRPDGTRIRVACLRNGRPLCHACAALERRATHSRVAQPGERR